MKIKDFLNRIYVIISGNIVAVLFSVIIVGVTIYNCMYNPDFLKTNIGSILTISIAIVVAYILNQRKSDERKKKDQIEKLLIKIQISLSSEYVVLIKSENSKKLNIFFQRFFANRLEMLSKLNSSIIKRESILYIEDNFKKYRDTIGEHIHDIEKLAELEIKLTMYIQNIDYKIDDILLNIYK